MLGKESFGSLDYGSGLGVLEELGGRIAAAEIGSMTGAAVGWFAVGTTSRRSATNNSGFLQSLLLFGASFASIPKLCGGQS